MLNISKNTIVAMAFFDADFGIIDQLQTDVTHFRIGVRAPLSFGQSAQKGFEKQKWGEPDEIVFFRENIAFYKAKPLP